MHLRGAKILICLLMAAAFFPDIATATAADDLQAKIDAQNQSISALQSEIAGYQSQLDTISTQKNTLSNAVKSLNVQAAQIGTSVKLTGDKLTATSLKVSALNDSIGATTANIEDLHKAIVASLKQMNENDRQSLSTILTGKLTLAQVWQDAAAEDALRNSLREKTTALIGTKQTLLTSVSQVQAAKDQLVALSSELKDQQTLVKKSVAEKASLLASTKNQESAYQKMVDQKTAVKNQMQADLDTYESQLKYINDPSELPQTGSKTFAWPLDTIRITQLFGKTVDSARLYVTGTHNGVDFAANVGTPAKAMASGVVIGEGNSDLACKGASYGNWIFIKYDNGLSAVFGHLSLIKAPVGERVTTGDIVAYTGKTGYATGPHLHVSVWPSDGVHITSFPSQACPGRTITIPTAAANAYLDPMLYFPKK